MNSRYDGVSLEFVSVDKQRFPHEDHRSRQNSSDDSSTNPSTTDYELSMLSWKTMDIQAPVFTLIKIR